MTLMANDEFLCSDGKESAYNAGNLGLIPGLGRTAEKGMATWLPWLFLGGFHGQRSLAGCSPWGCKELEKKWGGNILSLSRTHLKQEILSFYTVSYYSKKSKREYIPQLILWYRNPPRVNIRMKNLLLILDGDLKKHMGSLSELNNWFYSRNACFLILKSNVIYLYITK